MAVKIEKIAAKSVFDPTGLPGGRCALDRKCLALGYKRLISAASATGPAASCGQHTGQESSPTPRIGPDCALVIRALR